MNNSINRSPSLLPLSSSSSPSTTKRASSNPTSTHFPGSTNSIVAVKAKPLLKPSQLKEISEKYSAYTQALADHKRTPNTDSLAAVQRSLHDLSEVYDEDAESAFLNRAINESRLQNAPSSKQDITRIVGTLSKEEIKSIVNDLPEKDLRHLANELFEEKDTIGLFDKNQLQEQLIDLCCQISSQAQPPLDSPEAHQIIASAFLTAPASIARQGLHNSGVDCYLNSALQGLRENITTLPQEQQQAIVASLRARHLVTVPEELRTSPPASFDSPLAAFLEKKYDARQPLAAAFLRQEVQALMTALASSGRSSSGAAREMANNINRLNGNSLRQDDASVALQALMEHVGTPRILLHETDTYADTGAIREVANQEGRQHGGELILPFGIKGESSLQNVIASNLTVGLTGINDGENGLQNIHKERELVNPPTSLTLSLSRFTGENNETGRWVTKKLHTPITGITNAITMPVHQEEDAAAAAIYQPSSIICHTGGESANSGHYVTYRKEGENWLLINDEEVTAVNLEDVSQFGTHDKPLTHQQFLEQNAYVISYRR